MFKWEQVRERAYRHLTIGETAETLAPDQLDRLTTYRAHLTARIVDIELELDERRLAFARWLYEHGRISDYA
jgi:hypothetical protein